MTVNFSHALRTPTARLLLVATAALTAFAIAVSGAEAGSGGLGTGTEQAHNDAGSGKKAKQKARYDRLWSKVNRRNKRWAKRTAECESGGNPRAIGGGGAYRGAFQFMKSTWKASPKSPGGDPVRFNYRTQAVVAVALKKRDGAQHWPHCG